MVNHVLQRTNYPAYIEIFINNCNFHLEGPEFAPANKYDKLYKAPSLLIWQFISAISNIIYFESSRVVEPNFCYTHSSMR